MPDGICQKFQSTSLPFSLRNKADSIQSREARKIHTMTIRMAALLNYDEVIEPGRSDRRPSCKEAITTTRRLPSRNALSGAWWVNRRPNDTPRRSAAHTTPEKRKQTQVRPSFLRRRRLGGTRTPVTLGGEVKARIVSLTKL